jgi:transcriptional regulator with XRE-family HTH domain
MRIQNAAVSDAARRQLVGRRLRETRRQRGIGLRELAGRIGVSPSAISEFELGKSWPKLDTLLDLASELDVSLDELFTSTTSSEA